MPSNFQLFGAVHLAILGAVVALAGATMALLTPNLWEPFPSFGTVQFFVDHGLIVASVLFLAWSGLMRPRAWSVARAMVVLNVLAALIGVFNFVYKTDYMYLRAKPRNASLLDLLGPWPWYLVATEFVALALFLLLYLPFRDLPQGRLRWSAAHSAHSQRTQRHPN